MTELRVQKQSVRANFMTFFSSDGNSFSEWLTSPLVLIRIPFPPQLSDLVPLRNGFHSFRAQTDERHPVDPDSYTVVATWGRRPTSLMRTHKSSYARSEYHTQLAKMSFDEIFDLTAGVYFHFL